MSRLMKRTWHLELVRWVLERVGAAVVVSGVAASGCGCLDPLPDCYDPAVGSAPPHRTCGIYVSSSLGDDANVGDTEHPVRTLEKASNLAGVAGLNIYACAETFQESLGLGPINFWGGFDCADGWRYRGGEARTIILAPYPVLGMRVGATIANVRIEVPDADVPGDSVIALFALGDSHFRLISSEILVGNGAEPGGSSVGIVAWFNTTVELVDSQIITGNGADGDPPDKPVSLAPVEGSSGDYGWPACYPLDDNPPHPEDVRCDEGVSIGGKGGAGYETYAEDGTTGEPLSVPNPTGAGLGGTGQSDRAACTEGRPGLHGADGAPGKGAKGPASFNKFGHSTGHGEDGQRGRPGQGGGGGGGSRGGLAACGGMEPSNGAWGGMGGVGGCGGAGGWGGRAAGVSAGIISFSGNVTARGSTIQTGNGGHGGTGASLGQEGAPGGDGGDAGVGRLGALHGCKGGSGGKGGRGGSGGGGLGGHSVGIAIPSNAVPKDDAIQATFVIGTPGKGGLGGDSSIPDSAGDDGTQAELFPFVPTDERSAQKYRVVAQ
jgi:hypothetical protein